MNFSAYSEYLDHLIATGIPACEVVITKNHKVIYHEWRGYSDEEKTKKASPDDLYFIYSSSKVLTCSAIMRLMEENKDLMLSTPISDILPEWKSPFVRENGIIRPAKREITVENLMTMGGGLTYNKFTQNIQDFLKLKPNATARELSVAIAKDGLVFDPGDSVLYSLCHDILFALIEEVTGERASEYVKRKICMPLGIKDLYYHKEEEGVAQRLSAQYSMRPDGTVRRVESVNEYVFSPSYDSGGAGVITTCSEYSKFVSALANGGVGANGERILSTESIDNMRTNRLTGSLLKDFYSNVNGRPCYGYGLGVQTLIEKENAVSGNKSLSNIGEFGWGGAAGANMTIDPSENLSVFYVMHILNVPVPKGERANCNDNYRFKTRDLAYVGLQAD